jgi:VanZ family protein
VKNTCPRLALVKILLITFIFAGLYGLSDELHQLFVPGRDCSAFDLFIDLTGSFLGSLIGGKIL